MTAKRQIESSLNSVTMLDGTGGHVRRLPYVPIRVHGLCLLHYNLVDSGISRDKHGPDVIVPSGILHPGVIILDFNNGPGELPALVLCCQSKVRPRLRERPVFFSNPAWVVKDGPRMDRMQSIARFVSDRITGFTSAGAILREVSGLNFTLNARTTIGEVPVIPTQVSTFRKNRFRQTLQMCRM